MTKKKSIIRQLFISHFILVGLSVAAVAWIALSIFQNFYYSNTAENLAVRLQLIAKPFSDMIRKNQFDEMQVFVKNLGNETQTRITIILPDGRVVADSHNENPQQLENHADRPEIIQAQKNNFGNAHRFSYTLKQNMMYSALVLQDQAGQPQGYLRMALPLTGLHQTLVTMNLKILYGVMFILVLTTSISFWVSRRMIRPLVKIKKVAEKYAAGDLDHKLYPEGSEELWSLADTLNTMAVQLKQRIGTIDHQRQELDAVLSGMVEGVLAVDQQENLIYMNASCETLFEIEPGWKVGKKIHEIVRNIALQEFMVHVLSTKKITTDELRFYKNGERIMQVTGSPISTPNNIASGAIMVFNDITRLHKLENVRRDFVSNVSHELKTPITLIQGFVETLLDDKRFQQGETNSFLMKIKNNSYHLNTLIEDLLDLSRIEQMGVQSILKQETPVHLLVEEAIQTCVSMFGIHQEMIKNKIPKKFTLPINAQLFEQVLFNLVSNAIKYSGSKKAIVVMGRREAEFGIIEVQDFGVGIAAEHLPRLFERFYRVDKSRNRKEGGTGLGLAIAKHIIQAHEGEIVVESQLQKGTIFRITLPLV